MELIYMMMPGVFALTIAVYLWSRPNPTLALRILAWVMFANFLYITSASLTSFRYVDPTIMVWAFICLGFTVPSVQVMTIILCWSMSTQRQRYNRSLWLLLLVPFVTGLVIMAGYGVLGFDAVIDYYGHANTMPAGLSNIEIAKYDLFRFMTKDVYLASCGILIMTNIIYSVYLLVTTDFTPMVVLRFLFNKGPIRPMHLFILLFICFLVCSIFRMRVDRQYSLNHTRFYTFLFSVQAVLIFLIGLVSIRFKRPCIYLVRPHAQPTYDDLPVLVHNPNEKNAENEFADEEAESYRTLNLRHELRVLMREECCYLQPGMSRYSVSRRLDIRREGLDQLIKLLHHVTYEEYCMVQRVEYCRRYRLQYPDEPLESVAMACGFPNAKIMKREIRECYSFFQPIDKQYLE